MSQTVIDIQSYIDTYQLLNKAIEGLSEEQLKWKAAADKWSVTEVLSHLVDHNIVVSFRIREILAGSEVRLPAFNQDLWVDGSQARHGDANENLAIFHALLIYNSQLFKRLSSGDWSKTGVNFKGETVSLAGAIQAFIKHAHGHLGQIDRIKQAISLT
ncbi:DinB family protein [Paenibacillus eucommiae]|uniref:DinB-like domain-containing protein n=1 Tax=Paenibacillus eucommiae TaxID=1355755 RepID=A0ABS4IZD4_9BACL|nr:DinB family protein [Paenibacillus eucommiae]MBP1992201.1 hypothetical protein [Paenibacillus eucommiae]